MLFVTRPVCYGIRLLDAGMDPGSSCVLILYTFGLIIVPRRDFIRNKTYLILYLPSPPLSTVFEASSCRRNFSVLNSGVLFEEFWLLRALSWCWGVLFCMVRSRLGFSSRQLTYYRPFKSRGLKRLNDSSFSGGRK